MNKMKRNIFLVTLACMIIGILLLIHGKEGPNTTPSMGVVPLLLAHWIGVIKFFVALVAAIMLLWQGVAGNILKTVRSSVILIGTGILAIAIGYGYDFYKRIFTTAMEGSTSATLLSSILYVVGAIFVAWALFMFPNKLQAKLRESRRKWFFISIIIAFVITIIILLIPTGEKLSTFALITRIAFPVLTLLVFVSALRCTMVFAEGIIGRPFLLISIGSLAMFLFNYIAWAPIIPNMGEFGIIHVLFIFSFLMTSIGAVELTLRD